jgi:flagellar protein FliS
MQSTEQKEDILLLLLDAVIRHVDQAREGIETGDPKMRGEHISKAIAILTELDCALDRSQGLSLVDQLSDLYGFMIQQLTRASVKNDAAVLDTVPPLLKDIQEAFQGAAEQVRQASSGAKNEALEPAEPQALAGGGFHAAV